MIITVTNDVIRWLTQRRIFSSCYYGHSRWKLGDLIAGLDDVSIEPYVGFYEGNILCEIGSFSYCSSSVGKNWKIGRYCSLSWNITSPNPNHPLGFVSTSNCTYDSRNGIVRAFVNDHSPEFAQFYEVSQKPEPIIENDVWVGAGAVLLPGVRLATGSVIAANSVVVKDVQPYEIVGGNPARHIRFRFPEEIRKALHATNWWQYKFTDFEGLDFNEPEKFIKNFERYRKELTPWSPRKFKLSDVQR